MRKTILILPVVAVALLAGCSAPTVTPSSATATPTAASTAIASATPTPTPTATPSVDPDAPAGQCADAALSVAVSDGEPGAGNVDYELTFTNTGTTACELEGFPGVSAVAGDDGAQVGSAAKRSDAAVTTVDLAPGASASADLRAVNVGTDGGALDADCDATAAAGYRVYPPHSFAAVFVAVTDLPACASDVDWMTVGPVTAD